MILKYRLKNFFKILLINSLITILGLIIIELYFGGWLKKSNYSNLLIPRQQTNLIKTFPYEHDTLGIYSRDKYGFRSNEYNLNEINILILGGSTTEEREVDDNKIWTKIFENNLKEDFKVLNAGIGGQTSYGHKSMFNMWFQNYSELTPEYIIVYLGINDALYFVEKINQKNIFNIGREINLSNRDTLVHVRKFDKFIQYIKNNSVLHTIYLIIKGNMISREYKISYNSKPSKFESYQKKAPKNLEDLNQDFVDSFEKYYLQNLSEIINHSKVYNAKTLFITQTISPEHWLNEYLEIINSFTLKFCKTSKLQCINLEMLNFNSTKNFYYDGIHTTPEGSKFLGKYIAIKFNNLYSD
jgi:lysophospholipase L1-like esterase